MTMNKTPLFVENCHRRYVYTTMLVLATCFVALPAKAQVLNPTPTVEVAQTITEEQKQAIKQKAEQFIEQLGKQEYGKARAALSPQLQAFWTAEKLEKAWNTELIATTGAYRRIVRSKAIDVVNADMVKVTVEFAQKKADIWVTFNKNQQLIGVDWPTNKNIKEIAQDFVNALATKDYGKARGYLHPFLKAEAFPQQIQQKWENLLQRTGAYQRQVGIEVKQGDSLEAPDVIIVTIQFDKVTDDLFIFFDKDKQIVNVDFPEVN